MNAVVTPLLWLRERLRSRQDSEHEQTIIRIAIYALVLAVMAGIDVHALTILLPLILGLLLAVALFVAICIWPAPNVSRRVIGIVADTGLTTWLMFVSGEYGVALVGVYLFVAFGNGFRYGRRYLLLSQALALIGFLAVMGYAPYWRAHPNAGWSLMIALIVLPLYVSKLVGVLERRLHDVEQRNRAIGAIGGDQLNPSGTHNNKIQARSTNGA